MLKVPHLLIRTITLGMWTIEICILALAVAPPTPPPSPPHDRSNGPDGLRCYDLWNVDNLLQGLSNPHKLDNHICGVGHNARGLHMPQP